MRLIILLSVVFGVFFAATVEDRVLSVFLTCVCTAVGVNIANRLGYR